MAKCFYAMFRENRLAISRLLRIPHLFPTGKVRFQENISSFYSREKRKFRRILDNEV